MNDQTTNSNQHPRSLLIIGGGGHARVVAEAAALAGWRIAGFLDDDPDASMGPGIDRFGALSAAGRRELTSRHPVIIALGDLRLRRELIAARFAHGSDEEIEAATVIHPRAIVAPSAKLGPGVFIGPGAVVHTGAHVGAHATVNSGAIVEHEVTIGLNSHVAPGATLGGSVTIGEDTLVGLGARVLPGARVGDRVIVGAGAVVIHDTPNDACVVGVPAVDVSAEQS